MEHKLRKIVPFSFIFSLLMVKTASAEGLIEGPAPENANDLLDFIIRVQGIVMGVVGIIAVGVIVYSGILFILAQGNPEKLSSAKKSLTAGVVGLVIIIMAEAAIYIFSNVLGSPI